MPIRIRPLRRSDYDAMIDLFKVCGLNPRTRGRDAKASVARQLQSNRTCYLGAFDGTRLIGTVLGTHDTRKGWINRLAVHPEYRRRGLAARLVRACERALRRHGIEMFAALIEVDNDPSKAVFEALGYEIMPMTYARRKVRREV